MGGGVDSRVDGKLCFVGEGEGAGNWVGERLLIG